MFKTFKMGVITYLAIEVDRGNVHILDVNCNNYGTWYSIESFKKRWKRGEVEPYGRARLLVQPRDEGAKP